MADPDIRPLQQLTRLAFGPHSMILRAWIPVPHVGDPEMDPLNMQGGDGRTPGRALRHAADRLRKGGHS